ncbi:MAG: metal-dependent transcriptional regulator [Nitrospinae bacterium]|nr:metal-dependent transcriptional regulator [Nitrospinota bacterium]
MGGDEDRFRKDEFLEMLWHLDECHDLTLESLRTHDQTGEFEKSLTDFSASGVVLFDGTNIELTDKGREVARDIIRRHRLAERLVADVLNVAPNETENAACEFEHVLAPELVESICILLGHPRTCPHGSPIPKGKCCEEERRTVDSMVMPLSSLKAGEEARIAHINTPHEGRMFKLLSLGIAPGAMVKVSQKKPTMVLEVNKTLVAIENTIGDDISVWRGK